jgi:hypothetical protein
MRRRIIQTYAGSLVGSFPQTSDSDPRAQVRVTIENVRVRPEFLWFHTIRGGAGAVPFSGCGGLGAVSTLAPRILAVRVWIRALRGGAGAVRGESGAPYRVEDSPSTDACVVHNCLAAISFRQTAARSSCCGIVVMPFLSAFRSPALSFCGLLALFHLNLNSLTCLPGEELC